jgi:hypothetical protein
VFSVDDVLGHVDEYGDRPATLYDSEATLRAAGGLAGKPPGKPADADE